jgi:hypothetical protein
MLGPRRRLTLWLAAVAITFAGLAPALSHALALASGSANWIEVCTAQGSRWVAADADAQALPADPAGAVPGHFDHCPCCHAASVGMAPPPAHQVPALPAGLSDGPPERFFSAACTAFAWRCAPSRAPPTLS